MKYKTEKTSIENTSPKQAEEIEVEAAAVVVVVVDHIHASVLTRAVEVVVEIVVLIDAGSAVHRDVVLARAHVLPAPITHVLITNIKALKQVKNRIANDIHRVGNHAHVLARDPDATRTHDHLCVQTTIIKFLHQTQMIKMVVL